MVKSLIQKANFRLKFLYRKQIYLNLHASKLLVMSLVQCHFVLLVPWISKTTAEKATSDSK